MKPFSVFLLCIVFPHAAPVLNFIIQYIYSVLGRQARQAKIKMSVFQTECKINILMPVYGIWLGW